MDCLHRISILLCRCFCLQILYIDLPTSLKIFQNQTTSSWPVFELANFLICNCTTERFLVFGSSDERIQKKIFDPNLNFLFHIFPKQMPLLLYSGNWKHIYIYKTFFQDLSNHISFLKSKDLRTYIYIH